MNSSDATRQDATGRPVWDLIQAQDLIAEISELQRFLSIAHTLLREGSIELDPDLSLLFYSYWDSDVPEKLQATSDLLDRARKDIS